MVYTAIRLCGDSVSGRRGLCGLCDEVYGWGLVIQRMICCSVVTMSCFPVCGCAMVCDSIFPVLVLPCVGPERCWSRCWDELSGVKKRLSWWVGVLAGIVVLEERLGRGTYEEETGLFCI